MRFLIFLPTLGLLAGLITQCKPAAESALQVYEGKVKAFNFTIENGQLFFTIDNRPAHVLGMKFQFAETIGVSIMTPQVINLDKVRVDQLHLGFQETNNSASLCVSNKTIKLQAGNISCANFKDSCEDEGLGTYNVSSQTCTCKSSAASSSGRTVTREQFLASNSLTNVCKTPQGLSRLLTKDHEQWFSRGCQTAGGDFKSTTGLKENQSCACSGKNITMKTAFLPFVYQNPSGDISRLKPVKEDDIKGEINKVCKKEGGNNGRDFANKCSKVSSEIAKELKKDAGTYAQVKTNACTCNKGGVTPLTTSTIDEATAKRAFVTACSAAHSNQP